MFCHSWFGIKQRDKDVLKKQIRWYRVYKRFYEKYYSYLAEEETDNRIHPSFKFFV